MVSKAKTVSTSNLGEEWERRLTIDRNPFIHVDVYNVKMISEALPSRSSDRIATFR